MEPETDRSDNPADPRVHFAAERTLLAWVRTGLAMMGFGFVVARFGLFFQEIAAVQALPPRQQGYSLWLGTALVILGVSVNLWAAVKHWETVRRLELGKPLHFYPLSLATVTALVMAILGVLMATYLILGLSPAH